MKLSKNLITIYYGLCCIYEIFINNLVNKTFTTALFLDIYKLCLRKTIFIKPGINQLRYPYL